MEYDPGFDSLVCTVCGNIIDPQTLPDADSFYFDNPDADEGPEDIENTLSEFEALTGEMYDQHVYKCSQCGGEVLVSGTEISTRCIYCGSTSVVFSRISKENRPDLIVPFSVTKEEAINTVKKNILSGAFMPRGLKKLDPELVRGIYIPYFTYNGSISDTQQHRIGVTEKTYVFDGSAEFENLLVECCTALDDRSTALLEPYNLKEAVEFDTSYLMGFYSNIQDVTPRQAQGMAEMKAKTIFNSQMHQLTRNSSAKTVSSNPKLEMHRTGYILLPAWFITINAKGTPYTFLVNGQSGRCTGTAPWNKVKVFGTIGAVTAVIWTILFSLLANIEMPHIDKITDFNVADEMIYSGKLQLASGVIGVAAGIILFIAFKKLMRLYQKLKRTSSVSTHIFARRRQGGVK
jgi:DNA-directed RNA polymerase subunit RPC12/RpoP